MQIRKDTMLLVIFWLAMSSPLAGMLVALDPLGPLNENRLLAKRPPLVWHGAELLQYPQQFTRYFNDNFGFRSSLLRLNFLLRYKLLGSSPSKDVLLGKEGWLFQTGEVGIAGYGGFKRIAAARLDDHARNFEKKRAMLAGLGIHYLVVIAPNKSSVYPEYLPAAVENLRIESRTDTFIDYLKSNTQVELLDLRSPLVKSKQAERLYSKTDTHWNDYGALIAYREVMNKIAAWFPGETVRAPEDFKAIRNVDVGGDLALMIGGAELLREEKIRLTPLQPRTAMQIGAVTGSRGPVTYVKQNPKLPRAMVFRDSFFDALIPFVAEHFQYSKYYSDRWSLQTPINELLTVDRPDVVIEEIVERQLY